MSEAVRAALPWIVHGLAAAILIPSIIDVLRKNKKRGSNSDKKNDQQNTWMMEGVGIGMVGGYWGGYAINNAVLGLALGILAGMFIGSKLRKSGSEDESSNQK